MYVVKKQNPERTAKISIAKPALNNAMPATPGARCS
jgi:hypothetical protein